MILATGEVSRIPGQCCVSGSRLIVERSVAEEFEKLLIDKLSRIRIGDPLDPQTQIGAITTVAQNKAILGYIEAGRKEPPAKTLPRSSTRKTSAPRLL